MKEKRKQIWDNDPLGLFAGKEIVIVTSVIHPKERKEHKIKLSIRGYAYYSDGVFDTPLPRLPKDKRWVIKQETKRISTPITAQGKGTRSPCWDIEFEIAENNGDFEWDVKKMIRN